MKNRKAGLTMIELMVGVLLVAIAAVVGLQFLIYCDTYTTHAESRVAAVNLALETMEEFYMRDSATLGADAANEIGLPPSAGGFIDKLRDSPGAKRSYIIGTSALQLGNPPRTYRTITVTVQWN